MVVQFVLPLTVQRLSQNYSRKPILYRISIKVISSLLIIVVFVGCSEDETTLESSNLGSGEVFDNSPVRVITWEKDGATMVYIPAGSFKMGDHFEEGESDELPVHEIELSAFYMDRYEVTIEQYTQFLTETNYGTLPERIPNGVVEEINALNNKGQPLVNILTPTNKHPIAGVSYNDAVAYANWAGKRLPTEAEWEYAARGGLVSNRYVWGNENPESTEGNFYGFSDKVQVVDDGFYYTAPVGHYRGNDFGLYDMAGNVWEWCSDWYGEDYYANSDYKNPSGPGTGTERVIRGGGWSSYLHNLRLSRRLRLSSTAIGFPQEIETVGLKKHIMEKAPNVLGAKKINQVQKPEPVMEEVIKEKEPLTDYIVWVGFRCVVDVTTDE